MKYKYYSIAKIAIPVIVALLLLPFAAVSAQVLTDNVTTKIGTIFKPNVDEKAPSITFTAKTVTNPAGFKELTNYDKYPLEHGLWYDEYTRIFSVGGKYRVIEISNFPRAYKDTVSHVYEKDVVFTVTETDLNYYDEKGARFYQDSRQKLFKLGEKATHWAGDELGGAFPLWLQYSNVQVIPNDAKSEVTSTAKFPAENIVSKMEIKSGVLLKEDGTMISLTNHEIEGIFFGLLAKTSSIALDKMVGRQILYIYGMRDVK